MDSFLNSRRQYESRFDNLLSSRNHLMNRVLNQDHRIKDFSQTNAIENCIIPRPHSSKSPYQRYMTLSSNDDSKKRESSERISSLIRKIESPYQSQIKHRDHNPIEYNNPIIFPSREKTTSRPSSSQYLIKNPDSMLSSINDSTVKKIARDYDDLRIRSLKLTDRLEMSTQTKRVSPNIDNAINAIYKKLKLTQHMDVCFVMDGTMSMKKWFDVAKAKIENIVNKILSEYEFASINLGLIVYRDFNLNEKNVIIFPFTTNLRAFRAFLDKLTLESGLDHPEDINGGFQNALKFKWLNKTRLLIHIADAPCHGSQFQDVSKDNKNHLLLSKKFDKPWSHIFQEMKEMEIDYHFIEIKKAETEKMISEFKNMWESIKVHKNKRESKLMVHSINDDTSKFVDAIIFSVQKSVLDSTNHILKEERVRNQLIPQKIPIKKVNDLNNNILEINGYFKRVPYGDMTFNFNEEEFKILQGDSKTIKIREFPFAAGTFNYAYEAWLDETNHPLIAKQPKFVGLYEEYWKREIKKNTIVLFLAQKFNEEISKYHYYSWAKILFIQSVLFETQSGNRYILEGKIDGKFEKYSNNLDHVDETREIRHLTAFAHYTYQATKGSYLVTDFQGVNGNLLTDPCLHSTTGEFMESGDFMYEGFIYFFKKHKCNEICLKLRLDRPEDLGLDNYMLNSLKSWNERDDISHHDIENSSKICSTVFCNELINCNHKHCKFCSDVLKRKSSKICVVRGCGREFYYKPYYYILEGLCAPKRCEECRSEKKRDLAIL